MNQEDAETYANSPLLRHLSSTVRSELSAVAETQDYGAGDLIFSEGDSGDALLLILSGRVRVSRNGFNIAERGPGECIGEMAVMDREPRSATVTAVTDCRILRWKAITILEALERWPKLQKNLAQIMSARLRAELYQRVEDMRQKRSFAAWLKTAAPRADAPILVVSRRTEFLEPLQRMFTDRKLFRLEQKDEIDAYFIRQGAHAWQCLPSIILLDRSLQDYEAMLTRIGSAAAAAAVPCLSFEVTATEQQNPTPDHVPVASLHENIGEFRFYWASSPPAPR